MSDWDLIDTTHPEIRAMLDGSKPDPMPNAAPTTHPEDTMNHTEMKRRVRNRAESLAYEGEPRPRCAWEIVCRILQPHGVDTDAVPDRSWATLERLALEGWAAGESAARTRDTSPSPIDRLLSEPDPDDELSAWLATICPDCGQTHGADGTCRDISCPAY